jgi:hypothetical protein
MKIKTSDLSDAALDWAVELAKGTFWSANSYFCFTDPVRYDRNPEYRYSTEWSQGGPIIETEGIDLYCNLVAQPDHADPAWRKGSWRARYCRMGYRSDMFYGPTPLIAALRCFVASKLGAEIDIPEELL